MTHPTTNAKVDMLTLTTDELMQVQGGNDALTIPDGQDDEITMSGYVKIKKLTSGG